MRRLITPRLALVSFAHFSIDGYSSFFSPLLPLLVTKLGLSLTEVGVLVAFASFGSSLSQPLFGWMADRLTRPWFVAFGPLVAAVFMSSVGAAPSFVALALLLLLGGLGAGAFHPQAAVLAGGLGTRRALSLSIFVTSGTVGFALGPLLAVTVAEVFGLERTWFAALPGLLIAIGLLAWFMRVPAVAKHEGARPAFSELRPFARPLSLLYLSVAFRSSVSFGFMTFLPIYLNRHGYSVAMGGAVLTAYLGAGALGGFLGGWMADRFGRRRVLIQSFVGAIPLFYGMLLLGPHAGIALAVAGNFVLQWSLPVTVVMGQELSPKHASTLSSLMMGGAWGLGVLMVGPTGVLADAIGLHTALLCLSGLLVFGLTCAVLLPDAWKHAHLERLTQPATS